MGSRDSEVQRLRTELRDSRALLESELASCRAQFVATEEELRTASAQLEQDRDRYAELYHHAPVAYLTLDRNGVVLDLNLTAAALLGDVRTRIQGCPLLAYVAESDRHLVLEHMRRCRTEPGPTVTELLLRQRGNLAVPVELSSRGADAPASGGTFHSVMLDLSERKRTMEALRRSERLAGMGTLTAGLAHEIKNPLHAILMSAQLLLADARPVLNPEQSQLLSEIAAAVHRCNRIIENMLRFARDEPTEKWPADLNRLVRRTAGLARVQGVPCDLSLRLCPGPTAIRANPTEIEQVLLNLVRNAAQAGPKHCRVELETALTNAHVELHVSDNGPGIPREHLPHLFDPFFTTHRGRGGTGLGLSIVHAIITDHAGTIHVDSELGRGTRFTIVLPLAQHAGGTAGEARRGDLPAVDEGGSR